MLRFFLHGIFFAALFFCGAAAPHHAVAPHHAAAATLGAPPSAALSLPQSAALPPLPPLPAVAQASNITVRAVIHETERRLVTAIVDDSAARAMPGSFQYQWLQSAAGGVLTPLVNATNSTYNVERRTYDVNLPFLVVSVAYTRSGAAGGGRAFLLSAPLRVAGSDGREILISSGSYTVGAIFGIIVGGNKDPFGAQSLPRNYRYQWQGSSQQNNSFENIAATLAQYTIKLADGFRAGGFSYLRVMAVDKASLLVGTLTAVAIRIPRGTFFNKEGVGLTIAIANSVYGAADNNVKSFNGLGTLAYAWLLTRDDSAQVFVSGSLAFGDGSTTSSILTGLNSYTPTAADFNNLPAGEGAFSVVLSVTHTNPFGHSSTFTRRVFIDGALRVVSFWTGGVASGDTLTADFSYDSAPDIERDSVTLDNYQWQEGRKSDAAGGEWADLGGASQSSLYTLPPKDGWNAAIISVRFLATHTDAQGTTTRLTSRAGAIPRPPGGAASVNLRGGVLRAGATLVVNLGDITDENGNGEAVNYQWLHGNDGAKSGETVSVYALTADDINDVNGGSPKVRLTYEDALGYSAVLTAAAKLLRVDIGRDAATLQATVTDNDNAARDGGGGYQWQQAADDSVYADINGATVSIYVLRDDYDFAKPLIRVRFSFINNDNGESLTAFSAPLTVTNRSGDSPSEGTPFWTGGVASGDTLTADVSGITDADGIGTFAGYQWQEGRASNAAAGAWQNLNGNATISLYILPQKSEWEAAILSVRFIVTHTDLRGENTTLTSRAGAIPRPPAGAASVNLRGGVLRAGATLVVNLGNITDANGNGEAVNYQWLHGNNDAKSGETVSVYALTADDLSDTNGGAPKVRLTYEDALGYRATFTAAAKLLRVDIGRDAATLQATVTDADAAARDGGGEYQWQQAADDSVYADISGATNSLYILPNGYDFSKPLIRVRFSFINDDNGETLTAFSAPLTVTNRSGLSPSEGTPFWTGGVASGDTLTADVSVVTDADGIGTFAGYQWQEGRESSADGGAWQNLNGNATISLYILPQKSEWEAAILSVRFIVTHTDLRGENTTLTSRAGAIPRPPGGAASVNLRGGVLRAGATVEVNLGDITDANGNGEAVNYQWLHGNDDAKSGETVSVYALTADDLTNTNGGSPKVRLTYEDALGYRAVLTAASKLLRVDIARDASTLQATVTDNDAAARDGGGEYQWQQAADGAADDSVYADINGATGSLYILPSDYDFAKPLARVRFSFINDDNGETLTAFSAPLTVTNRSGDSPSEGTPFWTGGVASGDTLTADVSVVTDADGIGTFAGYQWQEGRESSADGGAWQNLNGNATISLYILPPKSEWDAAILSVRFIVTHTDLRGENTTLTSRAGAIPRPPAGAASVTLRGGVLRAGATLVVNLGDIIDANGNGEAVNYQWLHGNNDAKSGETVSVYALTADDLTNTNGGSPKVRLTYEDALGYRAVLTAAAKLLRVDIGRDASTLQATVTDNDNAARDGGGEYQWQQADDSDYADINGATGSLYILRDEYDFAKPLIRVRFSFINDDNGETLTAFSAPLTVTNVSGITPPPSGVAATIILFGYNAGALASIDISVQGGTPSAESFTYQWQTGTSAAATATGWRVITAATEITYPLALADFDNSRRNLRAIIAATASPEQKITLGAVNINKESQGEIRITGPTIFRDGNIFSADTSGVADDNGVGKFTYAWYAKPNSSTPFAQISGADGAVYTLKREDFPGTFIDEQNQNPQLSLQAKQTDVFGFEDSTAYGAKITLQQRPPSALRILSPQDGNYGDGGVFIAQADITDERGRIVADSYQWMFADADGNSAEIPAAPTGEHFTLRSGLVASPASDAWSARYEYIMLEADYVDADNVQTRLTSGVALVAKPTEGTLHFAGAAGAGSTVEVFADLRDANSNQTAGESAARGGVSTYKWHNGNGVLVLAGTVASYIITENDISLEATGKRLSVEVTYEDGLGFTAVIIGAAQLGLVFVQGDEAAVQQIAALFNDLERILAVNVLGAHLDAVDGDGNGNGKRETYAEINEVRVDGKEDIAQALATRAANSRNVGRDFAVDNFVFQITGDDGSDAPWSAWARGGWVAASGSPLVKGERINYEGDAFGLYGGVDWQLGENFLFGLAVGRTEVELKLDFFDTGDKTGKAWRKMRTFFPYVEWQSEDGKGRLIGGFGEGEWEISQAGVCNATADSDWRFGAASGEYAFWKSQQWAANVVGDVSYASSDVDAAQCEDGRVRLPEITSSVGEWVFGGRLAYNGDAAAVAPRHGAFSFSPQIGVNARRFLGDLKDDVAFDLVGALSFRADTGGGSGLTFHLEGKTQINSTANQRDSFSGRVDYASGNLRSSLRTNVADGGAWLSHRWELGYASVWGINTLSGKLYIEREDSAATNIGAEIYFRF